MYLAQSTRKDSSGEALIGLIDGAQAIVMTLLVIEMPVLIIELVEHVKSSEELFFNLTMGQMISLMFLLIGIYLVIIKYEIKMDWKRNKNKSI